MNISTYIFGSLGNGYSQYPNDYAKTIFNYIYSQSSAPTQVVVHREEKLIYYAYVRKLEAGQYIGFCVVLNSVMLTDFKEMFSIFENIVTSLVVNGIILQFNNRGDIVSKANQLYTNQAEVSRVIDDLRCKFAKLENTSKVLPPVSYYIPKNKNKSFSIGDNINDIVKASVSYEYTFIYKQENFETQSLYSYKEVISRINKENVALKKKNNELQEESARIFRQKKQFTKVIFLIIIVIGCGIGLLFLNKNLNYTQNQLDDANNTISKKNTLIYSKDRLICKYKNCIDSLNSLLSDERNFRNIAEEKLTKVSNNYPFVVTSFSVSSDAVEFDYEAVEEKEVTVTLKAVNEKNSQIVSSTHTDTYYNGGGTKKLYFSKKLYTSDYYYVVLIYDGKIIAGKRW